MILCTETWEVPTNLVSGPFMSDPLAKVLHSPVMHSCIVVQFCTSWAYSSRLCQRCVLISCTRALVPYRRI